ncbi:hypothetical protein REPUB_Repub04eG0158400 [Reevesia pubescens]
MSRLNFHERPPRKDLMINGLRPSSLKIRKDFLFIQRSSAGVVVSQAAAAHPKQHQQQQKRQRQGPFIIYTYSPKTIHTQARDFMALVQKLTGFSRSDDGVNNKTAPSESQKNKAKDNSIAADNRQEDNDSSSALTVENGGLAIAGADDNNFTSNVPTTISPTNPFFADIPFFTPNSTDFFCSPRPVYKFADNTIVCPNLGNLNSPSLLEFMKGLPDY